VKNTLLLLALSGLFAVGCNRNAAPVPAAAGSGSGSGAAPAAAAAVVPAADKLLPPPDLAAWVAPAGFTKGAAVAPTDFVPLPPGALATAFRFEASDSAVEALAVRYPNERYARPHVSDVRTPDPGGSKVARKVVQKGSLVVEVRGADPAAVARFASAVATGLGVPPEPPAAGSGSGASAQ
jgi:hypothetical protein